MRSFIALLTLLAAALSLTHCKSGSQENSTTRPLRIGMELTYPPFEMKDPQGNPDGVSVRLAEALARDLGRPLEIVPMEFSGLIPALKSGNIDAIISSMTANDLRRQSIDFSDPYATTSLAILVPKDSPIQSAMDLSRPGTRVTVKSSTTGEIWATRELPQARITAYSEDAACVLEVAQNRADAFIYDQLSILRYHRQNPSTTRALLEPVNQESWAIGLPKNQPEFAKQINAFLSKFRASGGMETLGNQYLKEEKQALKDLGIPFILQ